MHSSGALTCEAPAHAVSDAITVAHVVLSLDLGGLERIVLDLLREGRKRGRRADVICLERPGTLAPQAEALGARVVCVDKMPGLRPGTIGRLAAALRRLHPEVVHTHQIGALFYAGPAARRAGVPLVVHTEHGKNYAQRRRTRWLGWLAGRYAARFFCVSADIAAEVTAGRIVPRRKIHVVANGIDTARFRAQGDARELRQELGIPAAAPVVGTIGRLSEIKQQDLLLRAFARISERLPEARLLLVGDGPLMGSLRQLAQDLGQAERVHFAGYQARPERYLQVMDLFALTSRSEGMPLAVLEAWAAGLPVLASDVGGLPELIDPGRNGHLFRSGDEAGLADGLYQLLRDREYARRLGTAGRQLVTDRYDVRHMAQAYDEHYRASLDIAGR